MINNLSLQKDFGRLERQVSQLCQIFDKKMGDLAKKVETLSDVALELSRRVDHLETLLEIKDKKDVN